MTLLRFYVLCATLRADGSEVEHGLFIEATDAADAERQAVAQVEAAGDGPVTVAHARPARHWPQP